MRAAFAIFLSKCSPRILSLPWPPGNPPGRYSRRMSESNGITGRWRITEMDNWDQEAVDLVQPGFIEFDDNGLGSLEASSW